MSGVYTLFSEQSGDSLLVHSALHTSSNQQAHEESANATPALRTSICCIRTSTCCSGANYSVSCSSRAGSPLSNTCTEAAYTAGSRPAPHGEPQLSKRALCHSWHERARPAGTTPHGLPPTPRIGSPAALPRTGRAGRSWCGRRLQRCVSLRGRKRSPG